ncbi:MULTISPECIES: 2'-5' RNA ligase family protein [Burkholderia]|uniref:2'-5' RNA ligase family protein n=1 Tax=Burkholderia TaxID=32008 RepID=UPI0009EA6DA0|nr:MULTISPECIES: 2'-5' RNA ligase family protein [Burkholderia]MBJ9594345.1 2'-5' RNA ligase family protein [Burkholderia seminalis]MBN3739221.1 2'-5' RNA ligase family protein [Burkholderia sp. Tr-20355]MCA8038821.1 2'-5' RNA ligase family protein [Burkholderia seminalis]MCA8429464.1 2'-5' RNA ligase family protein [Burkholderia seminalis]RQS72407.1 2'-5' RNA ligase family protein [Burkholderia seminalis]
MVTTAFVVEVSAAEPAVADLRRRFDASASLGVPPHITLLFPFMSPDEITSTVIRQSESALSFVPSFDFSLTQIGRFPTTTYLTPDPAEPFVALTTALVERFPGYRPYGGVHDGTIPHLTVAHGDAATANSAAIALEERLRMLAPIRTRCSSVSLLENTSGRWKQMHVFELPAINVRSR